MSGGALVLHTFSHVAMTFEATTGRYVIYVNGAEVASAASPGNIFTTDRNVLIGREDSFLNRPFNGLIDEVGIYNRALSAGEIHAIFAAGSAGKCKGGPCSGTGTASLSGKVKAKVGAVNPGTTLALTGPDDCSDTMTTDAKGKYGFTALANGTYTLTPSKEGCSFRPSSQTGILSGPNGKAKKFKGTCP